MIQRYCHFCAGKLRGLRMWCPDCRRSTISWLHVALVAAIDVVGLFYLLRPQVTPLRDLHVYVEPAGRGDRGTFYSRRADGPYYRWLYSEGPGRWRYARVRLDRPALRVLRLAPWDALPDTLRSRLGEHYLEQNLPEPRPSKGENW